jgi:hypothetical protein
MTWHLNQVNWLTTRDPVYNSLRIPQHTGGAFSNAELNVLFFILKKKRCRINNVKNAFHEGNKKNLKKFVYIYGFDEASLRLTRVYTSEMIILGHFGKTGRRNVMPSWP